MCTEDFLPCGTLKAMNIGGGKRRSIPTKFI